MAGFFLAASGGSAPVTGPSGTQQYSSGAGVFIVPTGVTELEYEAWSAGASGGYGQNDTSNGGSGGGGSGCWLKHKRSVTPGASIPYSIGAGGALVAPLWGAGGNDGGDTLVDNYTLRGGKGGKTGTLYSSRAGGAGGFLEGVAERMFLTENNATFNDECTASEGWSSAGGALSIQGGTRLRLTKTASPAASCSKICEMPDVNSDWIVYGNLRLSPESGVQAAFTVGGVRPEVLRFNTDTAGAYEAGALSLQGYATGGNAADLHKKIATGLNFSAAAFDFAFHYDRTFQVLAFYIKTAGAWEFKGYVLAEPVSNFLLTLDLLAGSPANSWVEVDYLTVCYPNIVAIGDSICEGQRWTNGAVTWQRYCNIWNGLRNNLIVNKGVGGRTSEQIFANITSASQTRARLCFLHTSTNDYGASVPISTRTSMTQNSINAIKAAGMQLVLLNSVYYNSAPALAYMKGWWDTNRLSLTGIDLAVNIMAVLKNAGDDYVNTALTLDGLHPNQTGNIAIGDQIEALITYTAPTPVTPPLFYQAGNNGTSGTLTPTAGNGGTAPHGGAGGAGPADISYPLWGNGTNGAVPAAGGSGCMSGATGSGAGAPGQIVFRWGANMTI
jgi:lysophospholipase L1-like esterase